MRTFAAVGHGMNTFSGRYHAMFFEMCGYTRIAISAGGIKLFAIVPRLGVPPRGFQKNRRQTAISIIRWRMMKRANGGTRRAGRTNSRNGRR